MPDRLWGIVPAAGVGQRMASGIPKQYLALANRTVIEWSLSSLLARVDITAVVVALATDDRYWPTLVCAKHPTIRVATGGRERASSVFNALTTLASDAQENDWVLVHDAARPCLTTGDLSLLVNELSQHPIGGLLATPVADTLKMANAEQHVMSTVSRNNLWRALTPQMFRFGVLRRALKNAAEKNALVTDESSAIELLGLQPRLIIGRADNIKITVADDLLVAERILQTRHSERG